MVPNHATHHTWIKSFLIGSHTVTQYHFYKHTSSQHDLRRIGAVWRTFFISLTLYFISRGKYVQKPFIEMLRQCVETVTIKYLFSQNGWASFLLLFSNIMDVQKNFSCGSHRQIYDNYMTNNYDDNSENYTN